MTHHQHPGLTSIPAIPRLGTGLSLQLGPFCEMTPGTYETVPPAGPPYLAWHQVADRNEGGVRELQDTEHLAGHHIQGQAWHGCQAPRAALCPALGHCGTGRVTVGCMARQQ